MKKKNKRKTLIVIIIVCLIIVASIAFVLLNKPSQNNRSSGSGSGGPRERIIVTEENLEQYLESQSVVKDLPKKASIHLGIGDINYELTGEGVKEGIPEDPDLVLYVPKAYLEDLTNGMCYAVRKAKNNGDLIIEMKESEAKLLWTYKGMLEYKECFGF